MHELPRASQVRWAYHSRTVGMISDNWENFASTFKEIMDHPGLWDGQTSLLAEGFWNKLQDFDFVFLLFMIREIFAQSDVLLRVLQERQLNFSAAGLCVRAFRQWLATLRRQLSTVF